MNLNTEIISARSNVKKNLTVPQDSAKESSKYFTPCWKEQDNFLIVTALGSYTGTVMTLDDRSKEALNISKSQLVLLPFETRRIQRLQAEEFCVKSINHDEEIDSFQLAYLIELFDVEHTQICSMLNLSEEEFYEILENDLELSVSECVEIANFFLSYQHTYNFAS
jgi:hypothetical protein